MEVTLSPWCKAVKKALVDKDMLIKDLAKETNFSIQHVSSIINGRRIGCYSAERKISEVLDIEYPYKSL